MLAHLLFCRGPGATFFASGKKKPNTKSQQAQSSLSPNVVVGDLVAKRKNLRTGKEIRFRFGSSEDKAGKEAKRRPTGW